MGSCIGKVKNTNEKLKVQVDLSGTKYEETEVFIPPIKYGYVCKVYDGDTFTIVTKMPYSKKKYRFSVRIKGIDCPELRTKDAEEKEYAIMARDYVSQLFNEVDNIVRLDNITYDKYGRLCSDVYAGDKSVAEELLKAHLAVVYDGGHKVLPLSWKTYYEDV